ncbi:MAG: molybdenum cofactor guanylyltransferase [Thermoprotei archaeon]
MAPVIILAGGKSQRMGKNKAFLEYRGRPFISLIVREMLKVSEELVVVIGSKSRSKFESMLTDRSVKFVNDEHQFANPLGGMLSGFNQISQDYAPIIPCDSPLINCRVVEFLFGEARHHSAAVSIWDEEDRMHQCYDQL